MAEPADTAYGQTSVMSGVCGAYGLPRRLPRMVGRLDSSTRLPGGPYTVLQTALFVVWIALVVLSWGWWSQVSTLAGLIVAGVGLAAIYGLRRLQLVDRRLWPQMLGRASQQLRVGRPRSVVTSHTMAMSRTTRTARLLGSTPVRAFTTTTTTTAIDVESGSVSSSRGVR